MIIDIKELRKAAENSNRGEAIINLPVEESVKIDVGIRINKAPELFVEVIIPLCREGSVDIHLLKASACNLLLLEERGYNYELSDSSIVAEKVILEKDLESEIDILRTKLPLNANRL